MSVTLGSKLPRDSKNGLHEIAHSLLENPHHLQAVIMLVDCGKIVEDVDEETRIPMARIRRIEVISRSDYSLADQLMRRALADRHGSQELPLEDQRDLFSFLNPDVTIPDEMADPDAVTSRFVTTDEVDDDASAPESDEDQDPDGTSDDEESGEFFDIEAEAAQLARKAEDDRIAAMQSKRTGRAPRVRAGKS